MNKAAKVNNIKDIQISEEKNIKSFVMLISSITTYYMSFNSSVEGDPFEEGEEWKVHLKREKRDEIVPEQLHELVKDAYTYQLKKFME